MSWIFISFPVKSLDVRPVSSTALEVSWEDSCTSNTANVDFDILYRLINRNQCEPLDSNNDMMESAPGTTITLTGLYPYSTYKIEVSASGSEQTMSATTNEAGKSAKSIVKKLS